MARRCTACGQSPSGLVRKHDFCEFCAAPLETLPEPTVTLSCYRCGKRFDAPQGSTTLCPECEQVPSSAPSAELPSEPSADLVAPILWGAALPITWRLLFAVLSEDHMGQEAMLLKGLITFFGGMTLLAVIGVLTGQSFKKTTRVQDLGAVASFAITSAMLWLLT